MITCIAIDDEPLALTLIESYIQRKQANLKYLGGFNDALAAQAFLKDNPVDLLFLDIQMPDINGLEIYKELAQKPMVIFTTAYSDFAAEGFDLEAVDYLLKPFSYERFDRAVTKAMEYRNYKRGGNNEDNDIVYVKSGYELCVYR